MNKKSSKINRNFVARSKQSNERVQKTIIFLNSKLK